MLLYKPNKNLILVLIIKSYHESAAKLLNIKSKYLVREFVTSMC